MKHEFSPIELVRTVVAGIGMVTLKGLEAVERAQDCWGQDDSLDQRIHSSVWNDYSPESGTLIVPVDNQE